MVVWSCLQGSRELIRGKELCTIQRDLHRLFDGLGDNMNFDNVTGVFEKSKNDFVSHLDLDLERRLKNELALILDVPILSEESNQEPVGDVFWVVDPLDGTNNFVNGLPCFGSSVALIQDGISQVGAVHNLVSATTYSAAVGAGARKCLKGSAYDLSCETKNTRLVGASTGFIRWALSNSETSSLLLQTLLNAGSLRNFGSQALQGCIIAEGALVASFSRESKLWDDAAARLIVQEAGGSWSQNIETEQNSGDPGDGAHLAELGTSFFGATFFDCHPEIKVLIDKLLSKGSRKGPD